MIRLVVKNESLLRSHLRFLDVLLFLEIVAWSLFYNNKSLIIFYL